MEYNDKYDWKLIITKNRTKNIQKYLETNDIKIKDDKNNILFTITKNEISFNQKINKNNFIICEKFRKLSDELVKWNNEMIKINRILWEETIKKLYIKYESTLKNINELQLI